VIASARQSSKLFLSRLTLCKGIFFAWNSGALKLWGPLDSAYPAYPIVMPLGRERGIDDEDEVLTYIQ